MQALNDSFCLGDVDDENRKRRYFAFRRRRGGALANANSHTDAVDGDCCAVPCVGGGNSMSINELYSACIFIIISSLSKSHSSSASIGSPNMPHARSNSYCILYLRACSRQSRFSLQYLIGFSITLQRYEKCFNVASVSTFFLTRGALYYYI